MNEESKACFKTAVDEIFNRWTGLKLAVEHMGGRNGQQTAIDIKNYVYDYCMLNDNIAEGEITELLDDIMDEEFETILEDNSTNEVSLCLVRQLHRCHNGKIDEVIAEFAHLPPITRWLEPGARVNNYQEDTESEEDSDEEMDADGIATGDAPQQNVNPNSNSMVQQMDEDGWITVKRRPR